MKIISSRDSIKYLFDRVKAIPEEYRNEKGAALARLNPETASLDDIRKAGWIEEYYEEMRCHECDEVANELVSFFYPWHGNEAQYCKACVAIALGKMKG